MRFPQARSRRYFLRIGCRSLTALGAAAAGLPNGRAQTSGDYKALVCVFLFGGNDANNLLVPNDTSTYANYQKIRQNLALSQSSLVSIHDPATNANYGLHPSFASIAPLYTTSKRLAILMNVGTLVRPVPRGTNGLPQLGAVPLPVNLYSHSDQQNEWQNAMPLGGTTTGWAGRLSDKLTGLFSGLVPPAITLAGNTLQLIGQRTQPSSINTSNFGLVASATDPGSVALQSMLGLSGGAALVQAAQTSLKDAIAVSTSKTYRYSHLAKVVLAGLQEYQFQQESGGGLSREDLMDTVRRAIQRASALTAADLKKMVPSLATIGSTAPFVGLLGTVIGIITAFQGIAATGSGGIGAVSAGIAEALVETALGLLVAIPAVWFYNYLTSKIEYFNVEMDNSSSEMVDFFIKKS